METNTFKSSLIGLGLAAAVLLLASGGSLADTVNLTAAPTQAALQDGQTVPMWGYSCGEVVAGSTATCAASNPNAGANWSPVVITIPSGTPLTINLANSLSFTTASGTNTVPTSLVIVGQLGGGLGAAPTRAPSPTHAPQGTTWPGTQGGTGPNDPVFTPPAQADRVRSFGTEVAAGTTQALTWNNLRPGTYLIESGTQPSIQGPMGLYGVVIVTDAAYPGQTFDQALTLLLSEIDPVQNVAVDTAVRTAGFSDALVWSGQTGACGDPAVHTCYPPAVNYDPRYYLINGVSFDRSNAAASALTVGSTATTGRVLLRFANAGLRMHIPSVVGADMALLAEDGNKLPGVPKLQSSVFLAAGKTYDVTIQPKQTTPGTYDTATYAVFDRQLSLSTNNQRDGGMQAYINVAGGAAPAPTSATAVADSYFVVSGNTLAVNDPAKGLLANDVGIYGVTLSGAVPAGLTLYSNGTFTYTGAPTSFSYCGNGATAGAACTTVTLADCTGACLGAAPAASGDSYSSNIASRLQVATPGVLENDTDPSGLPLKASAASNVTGGTVTLNPDGSFIATPTSPPTGAGTATVTFDYQALNSQNTPSATVTATVTFKGGSGLAVTVKDANTGAVITDYRWIIEEDRTIYIDPAIETSNATTPVRNVAVNFHTSHTPVVAQGCVGAVSCESGQTLLGVPVVCDVGNGACRPGTQKAEVNPGQAALDPSKRYYLSVLPGDGWIVDDAAGGHTMGGAQIAAGQTAVDVFVRKTPLEPAKISVFVFQDDRPLNGEHDAGGGIDVLAP
ncbi:MAG: Ig-like domain-containing protein, partial [Methanoregulaceae archaeon]|nr:Ig-like domain-containing protein [Methanoregulaceae archaeon]